MKKLLSIAIILFVSSTMAFSQAQQEEIDYYQSIFGMGKKQIVGQFLKIDENNEFWTLYNEYEEKRKELGQARIKLLMEYAESYDNLTDEIMDDLTLKGTKIRKDTDALISSYYKKMKKESGVKLAAQFVQIERYFINAVNMELYQSLPLIGELDD